MTAEPVVKSGTGPAVAGATSRHAIFKAIDGPPGKHEARLGYCATYSGFFSIHGMIPEGRNPWATLSVSRRGSVVVVRVGTELIEVVGEGMDVIEEVG